MTLELKVSDETIAKTYREDLTKKLKEVCALMNGAKEDGFTVMFHLNKTSDGSYVLTNLDISRHF